MGVVILAILKLAASALWVAGFYTIATDMEKEVVSGGSGGPAGMFEVFMQLGIFGLLQSVGALRGLYAWVGGSMETALNTRHFTLWKNSSGTVVAAEEDHAAPLWGCLISFVIGAFLVVVCSAALSPIMFIVNVSSALILLTSWGKDNISKLGIFLSVIVLICGVGGTVYGWNYISTRMDTLQERRKAKAIERQKQLEAQRAEQERIAAEQRAERERIAAEQRAERERQRAERKAAQEQQRALRSEAARQRKEEKAARRAAALESRQNNVRRPSRNNQVQPALQAPSVVVPQPSNCRNCRGSGQVKVSHKCPVCNGRGRVSNPAAQAANALNNVLDAGRGRNRRPARSRNQGDVSCSACGGKGKVQSVEPCNKCGGQGKVFK